MTKTVQPPWLLAYEMPFAKSHIPVACRRHLDRRALNKMHACSCQSVDTRTYSVVWADFPQIPAPTITPPAVSQSVVRMRHCSPYVRWSEPSPPMCLYHDVPSSSRNPPRFYALTLISWLWLHYLASLCSERPVIGRCYISNSF